MPRGADTSERWPAFVVTVLPTLIPTRISPNTNCKPVIYLHSNQSLRRCRGNALNSMENYRLPPSRDILQPPLYSFLLAATFNLIVGTGLISLMAFCSRNM